MKKESGIIIGAAVAVLIIGGAVYMFMTNSRPEVPSQNQQAQIQATTVSFTEIARGAKSKIADKSNYLITSQAEMNELWKLVDAKGPVPTVDFSREVVMAIFGGTQPTTGYEISVARVIDAANRVVSVNLVQPAGTCSVKRATTTPYEIIRAPITSLGVTHEDIQTIKECGR